ncbi:MAG: hypothetical protein AB8B47_06670 [Roseobacter sp.]
MEFRFGHIATTSLVAVLAVAGCSQMSNDRVARDASFDQLNPSVNHPVCNMGRSHCAPPSTGLLNAPNNVVYTTRAGINPNAVLQDLSSDADEQTLDAAIPAAENVDKKE